jgi:tetratricopeptide (TPR) repeat protein
VESELFTVDTGHLIGKEQIAAAGRNEATRELCRAYLASGMRLLAKRNMELACEHIEEAIHLARDNDDRLGEGAGLSRLGNVLYHWEDISHALNCYKQALHIARQMGGRRAEGYILFNMSLAQYALRDRARAIEHAESALEVLEQLDDAGVAHVRTQLAQWQGVDS